MGINIPLTRGMFKEMDVYYGIFEIPLAFCFRQGDFCAASFGSRLRVEGSGTDILIRIRFLQSLVLDFFSRRMLSLIPRGASLVSNLISSGGCVIRIPPVDPLPSKMLFQVMGPKAYKSLKRSNTAKEEPLRETGFEPAPPKRSRP